MSDIYTSEGIEVNEKIRIDIDGKWKVTDVIDFFNSAQKLYDYYSCYETLIDLNDYSSTKSNEWYEDQIYCIGYVNQCFIGKSTTFIDRNNKFYFFDQNSDNSLRLNLNLIEPLFLKRFNYASPGFKDLAGAGEIIGHLKDLCFKIIDVFVNKNSRRNEDRKLQLQNDILEIDRNKKFAELLADLGFSHEDIRKIILNEYKHSLPIVKLIQEEKIKTIE